MTADTIGVTHQLDVWPVCADDHRVKVAVGFIGHEADDALLGQSFLAKFEVLLESDRMTLRKRVQQPH